MMKRRVKIRTDERPLSSSNLGKTNVYPQVATTRKAVK